jgi:predicted ATP-dependent serine protease
LEPDLFLAIPEQNRILWERPGRKGCRSIDELRKQQNRGKTVAGFDGLGALPKKFKALIYGFPGSGKSTFALQFANVYPGQVLYVSAEEGFSESFICKLIQWEIVSKNITVSDAQTVREIEHDITKLHRVDLVIIDSLGMLDAVPHIERSAQVWIAHSTKDGKYKGDSDLAHVVDMVIQCREGIANVEKNRFAPCVPITIFEKEASLC